jgi:hypothetical protein
MSHVHLFLLGQLERSYAVSTRFGLAVAFSGRQTDSCQFAQWAVDNDDVANYLGYVEVALFNVSFPRMPNPRLPARSNVRLTRYDADRVAPCF